MTSRFLAWLALAAIPTALAQQHQHQSTSAAKSPDRTVGPSSAVAAPIGVGDRYASAFADYRRFRPDEPLVDWRGVNDELAAAAGGGGHAGHGRTTAAPKDSKPAPADHKQHGGQR